MSMIDWAFSVLAKFLSDTPYGEITFSVQEGRVVNVKKVISEKPPVDSKALKY